MRVVGIIPARGGSKGITKKNLRLLGDDPLIAHTIHAAQASKNLDYFLVSTDDDTIADVARQYTCPVVMRPPQFAKDDSPMEVVLLHALEDLREEFDAVVVLQPTSPLRTPADIDAGINLYANSGGATVVSISSVGSFHPSRMYRIADDELMPVAEEPNTRLRQQLPSVFIRNGALYICSTWQLLQNGLIIGDRVVGYVMPQERSVNIDEEIDLVVAEWMFQQTKHQ